MPETVLDLQGTKMTVSDASRKFRNSKNKSVLSDLLQYTLKINLGVGVVMQCVKSLVLLTSHLGVLV